MPTTLDPILEVVSAATARIGRSSGRLAHLLSFVPDEKLLWTPSSTARSPLRLVAHCAVTNRVFTDLILQRMPAPMPTIGEFFATLHAADKPFVTRESVLAHLEETTAELIRAIETVDADSIDAPRDSPFGALPVRFWIGESGDHLAVHAGQLAYLQTIWGDLDDHMG